MTIKIGVIGLSSGNGHPYSWAAIFNGYSPKEMGKCPFPVIPKYLSKEKWPESRISNAVVKGVWTQSIEISRSIAKSSLIENVYTTKEELVDNSDLILLARDDSENHYKNAYYAIKSRKPIFIDKPIALSVKNLQKLYEISSTPLQIFSCSSMSFCPSFTKLNDCLNDEELSLIEFSSPKSWDRYAVHLVDPFIKYLRKSNLNSYTLEISSAKSLKKETSIECQLTTSLHRDPITVRFITTGKSTGELGFCSFNKDKKLIIKESHTQPFISFKGALKQFLKINSGSFEGYKFDYDHHYKVVKILEAPINIDNPIVKI
tara:strand:- start:19020 stop:19970 length:951 start_codon:yes stop_codon:yes gene_type:complete